MLNATGRESSSPGRPAIPIEDWDRAPWNRWAFQHVRELLPTAAVWRGAGPVQVLPVALAGIETLEFTDAGRVLTIGTFLDESYTDGFLVLHRGRIVAERYANGMTPRTLHLAQSVSKSVVGVVAGILLDRAVLRREAMVTDYMPAFARTAYAGATIGHLLDMTSGVAWDETYTSLDSHVARMDVASGWKPRRDPAWPRCMFDLVLTLGERARPHGGPFVYRSIETDVLGFVLQAATGMTLADLVSECLWAPMGAEEDACFTVDPAGFASACGGFNASLRDFARFGWLIASGGARAGRRIVPAAWIADSRTPDRTAFQGDYNQAILPGGGYRNQFWVEAPDRSALIARGVFGQMVYIDPDAEFVAVKLSSWPEFVSVERTRTAFAAVRAIRDALVG